MTRARFAKSLRDRLRHGDSLGEAIAGGVMVGGVFGATSAGRGTSAGEMPVGRGPGLASGSTY